MEPQTRQEDENIYSDIEITPTNIKTYKFSAVLRARDFIYIEKFGTWNNGLNKEP